MCDLLWKEGLGAAVSSRVGPQTFYSKPSHALLSTAVINHQKWQFDTKGSGPSKIVRVSSTASFKQVRGILDITLEVDFDVSSHKTAAPLSTRHLSVASGACDQEVTENF